MTWHLDKVQARHRQDKISAAKRLPATLLDALRLLEANAVLRAALGEALVEAYLKLKMQAWCDDTNHLSEWEWHHTLNG